MYNLFTSKKDYRELWQKFTDSRNTPEFKEWKKKVYIPGQGEMPKVGLSGPELQAEIFSQELNLIKEQ